MIKETIVIILAPIIFYLFLVYQDKKRQVQLLSDRLHNAENNIVRLKNDR